jgi:hypothetical protein
MFDRGNFTEKRALATEIVMIIRSLDPPGRFLQKATKKARSGDDTADMSWDELSDERAIQKVRVLAVESTLGSVRIRRHISTHCE